MALIRSDQWQPLPNLEQPRMFELTEFLYLFYLRALIIGVVFTQGFITIGKSKTPANILKTLLHKTNKKHHPQYSKFITKFHQFPAELHRAAMIAAKAQVSLFLTKYRSWRSGIRKTQDANPPTLKAATNPHANCQGLSIKFDADPVKRKVHHSTDWVGICAGVKSRKKRQRLPTAKTLSVRLIIENKRKPTFEIGVKYSSSKNQKIPGLKSREPEYKESQYWMPLNHLNLINSPEGREFHESGR